MKNRILSLLCVLVFISSCSDVAELEILTRNEYASSMRGIACFDETVWRSGTKSVVEIDGNSIKISDEDLDFRDIAVFSENEAVVLSSGNGCKIYRTTNKGKTWSIVYKNDSAFFDGLDFQNNIGYAYADPIDSTFYLIKTKDFGESWELVVPDSIPATLKGEAGYAASGTGIKYIENHLYIASGGSINRIFKSTNEAKNWKAYKIPLITGEGSGVFSIDFWDKNIGIAVGGNYIDSTNTNLNCAVTFNGGKTWMKVTSYPPMGYRSCVKYITENLLVACGRTGIDISKDGGLTWQQFSKEGFYALEKCGDYIYFSGRKGKFARLKIAPFLKK